MVVAVVAAVVLVGVAPAIDEGGAQQQPRRCVPLGGLLVPRTVRRRLADRDEVTERLGGGVYRVTRCDLRGRLTSSMTVAPVRDPDGRRVLAPTTIIDARRVRTIDYGDPRDPRWARVWRRVRDRVAASVTKPTPGRPRPDPAFRPENATASVAAASACDDGAHITLGPRWPSERYPWRWRADRFGGNADTRDALEAAHKAWDRTYTNCDYGDISKITPEYKGSTDEPAGVRDNVSTVDKGDVDAIGCDGALACTSMWFAGDDFTEADVRFGDAYKWTNSGKGGAYDYRAVGTHEFGHKIGLADLYDNPNLTMSYTTTVGSTATRTLGRGDIRGLRDLYP